MAADFEKAGGLVLRIDANGSFEDSCAQVAEAVMGVLQDRGGGEAEDDEYGEDKFGEEGQEEGSTTPP